MPVTSAEKKQTRPLVDLVLLAHRRGEPWRLCGVMSRRFVEKQFETLDRCRAEARRRPPPACRGCAYRVVRVLGVYASANDRRQRRKTIVWLIAVKGDAQFRGESGLELSVRREQGRWALTGMLADGLSR